MKHDEQRRLVLKALAVMGASLPFAGSVLSSEVLQVIRKPIPSSGEQIPVMGIGTARTFDAIHDDELMKQLRVVMDSFFRLGGAMVDSSPMYGSAQEVIGVLLKQLGNPKELFSATKVWINGQAEGVAQMERSRKLWGVRRFDLMQIHNLRDWELHLETLRAMKAEGKLRYIGITTSHGRYHEELEEVLRKHQFDFVQFTYNIENRLVEDRLMPLAQDRGIATIINRPYEKGNLFHTVKGKPLPGWAKEIDVNSWGQYFLKFIVSHPGVTCVIPATTKSRHLVDNMGGQVGRLPDEKMRQEMIRYYQSLA